MSGLPDDEAFMAAALSLGRRRMGETGDNPAVGALLVKDGIVLAQGWTERGGRPHAEPMAVDAAGDAARGATLYVTLEPCSHHGRSPPCADAIIAAAVARVVSAMEDPNDLVAGQGHAKLRAAGIIVDVGICEAQARRAHLGHILRVTQKRPMVTLKLAETRDGYAAGTDHDPRLSITSAPANGLTHMMRAQHDAIMIGIGTARADDPLMTVRLPGMESSRPVRVVLDTHLSLSPRSRLAQSVSQAPVLVIAGEKADASRVKRLETEGAEIARVSCDAIGHVDLGAALRLLAARGQSRIFSEGGPTVAARLIEEGFADEVVVFTSQKPLGREGVIALSQGARAILEDKLRYTLAEDCEIGPDRMRRYERVP